MPPITLSKQQFLKRKPKGSYQKYLKYIAAARAKNKPATAKPSTAFDPTAPLSQDAITALVNSRVKSSMGPERLEITQQRSEAARVAAAQHERITGFSKAAAGMLAEANPGYAAQQASLVGAQGALAQGFTGDMRARAEGVAGAPAEAPNAAYALGGHVAGTSLAERAQFFTAEAAKAPEVQLGLGQAALRAAISEAGITDKKFAQDLVDLAAKAPEVRAKIIEDLESNEMNKLATRINAKYLGLKAEDQTFQQGVTVQQLRLEKAKLQAANKIAFAEAAAQAQEIDVDWSRQNGYASNAMGDPILKNGAQIKWKEKPSTAKKGGKGTAAERHPYRTAVAGIPDDDILPQPQLLDTSINKFLTDAMIEHGKYKARKGGKGTIRVRKPGGGYMFTTNNPKLAVSTGRYTIKQAEKYVMDAYGLSRIKARAALKAAGWPF